MFLLTQPTQKIQGNFAKDYMLALEAAVNIELYPRYYYDSLDVLAKYNFSEINEKTKKS